MTWRLFFPSSFSFVINKKQQCRKPETEANIWWCGWHLPPMSWLKLLILLTFVVKDDTTAQMLSLHCRILVDKKRNYFHFRLELMNLKTDTSANTFLLYALPHSAWFLLVSQTQEGRGSCGKKQLQYLRHRHVTAVSALFLYKWSRNWRAYQVHKSCKLFPPSYPQFAVHGPIWES